LYIEIGSILALRVKGQLIKVLLQVGLEIETSAVGIY
jgi:hypothetical protein